MHRLMSMTEVNLCTALAFAEVSQKKSFARTKNNFAERRKYNFFTGEVTREDEGISVLMAACHQVKLLKFEFATRIKFKLNF